MTLESPSDLFSKQASLYAKFRPAYPTEIYEFLVKNIPIAALDDRVAWDSIFRVGRRA